MALFDNKSAQNLLRLDNRGVHNFSLGALDSYFRLNAGIIKNKATMLNEHTLGNYTVTNHASVFVFKPENDIATLRDLQKKATIFSIHPLEGLEKKRVWQDVVYDLREVFDRSNYKKKKWHNKITYPFKWIEKNGIEIRRDLDAVEAKELHDKWVEEKFKDPTVHRIIFPVGRYLRCCKEAVSTQSRVVPVDYRIYAAHLDGKLVWVRIVSVQGDMAYDLANFGNKWDAPSQLSNYFNVWGLKDLYDQGIITFNCGPTFDKGLKGYKTHYPYYEITSYVYPRVKEVKKSTQQTLF